MSTMVSVRLPDELVALIDGLALSRGVTRTELVRAHLETLSPAGGRIGPLRATGKPVRPGSGGRARGEPGTNVQACPHPKDQQRVFPWGVVCAACTARIR